MVKECRCGSLDFYTPSITYYSINEKGELELICSENFSGEGVILKCLDCGKEYNIKDFNLKG